MFSLNLFFCQDRGCKNPTQGSFFVPVTLFQGVMKEIDVMDRILPLLIIFDRSLVCHIDVLWRETLWKTQQE